MSIFLRRLVAKKCVNVNTTGRITSRILKNQICPCLSRSLTSYNFSKISFQNSHQKNLIHSSAALNKVIPYILSDIGEGIKEVSVKEWFIKEGDVIEQFQNICEVQSDKASVTITSRFDGKVTKIYHKVDDIAQVGQPLIDVDIQDDVGVSSESVKKTVESSEKQSTSFTPNISRAKTLATPAVRRIAMQNKLNLSDVTSTGKGGRVLKEDILKHLNISSEDSNDVRKMKLIEKKPQQSTSSISAQFSVPPVLKEDKVVPISGFTKAMVKTMTASLKIPHFVYSDEIDVTELVAVRNTTKKSAAEMGVKLTFMPFFIKAASLSLDSFPVLNSSIDENCENITYKAAHNIGVAMDTPNGLVVPNIKNVQHKSILQIASELNRLQQDGMNKTLKPDDLVGGTFALSNIGIIGGTYMKPVILTPQVSIGALGKIQVLPRFDKDGNIIKAHIVCISWSADHRVIDGVTMANFSNKWKFYVENPSHLMLGL